MNRAWNNNGDPPHILPIRANPISMSDDRQEKAARLHSRQAQYSKQMSDIRAAASPSKRRRSLTGFAPGTPRQGEIDEFGVRGDNITPQRVPILANFEEWMKLATDNKINATNSWNFALIDYFHDMSLLKEGDGVNFQKASCTLDGCVKIYTSRVDSVATETGKLLSGLADSGSKKRAEAGEGEEEAEDDGEDDGAGKKKRTRAKRSAESTLVSSFDQLRLKKMDLEFAVDPLFKKASADFDEGGAKGLLLNHLCIDGNGRIVFDSSDDAEEDVDVSRRDSMEPEERAYKAEPEAEEAPIDIAALASRFFPDLSILDSQDICPSLKTFELGSGETALDLPFLKAPERPEPSEPENVEMEALGGLDIGDEDNAGGFDMPDVGFGEGGEAWAKDAAMLPQMRLHEAQNDDSEVGILDGESSAYAITLQQRDSDEHDNILNYFDTALHKNWAGPEHWKITRIKDTQRTSEKPRIRKEKEQFEIDFNAPMTADMASMLYTTASSNSAISMPKREWRSKNRNLLPDDKHFNSKDLLRLFLKPKAKLGFRKSETQQKALAAEGEVDEAYWASVDAGHDAELPKGDYDANFFADDQPMGGLDDDDDEIFADAREMFSPDADGIEFGPSGPGIDGIVDGVNAADAAFGAQLITQSRRIRPEYVQYARVAKKVDVRRLKEEMWRGTSFSADEQNTQPQLKTTTPQLVSNEHGQLKFTDMMNNLRHVYPKQQLADISTSYGFICLLHLANEKGLTITNVDGWQDLTVAKDLTVVGADDG